MKNFDDKSVLVTGGSSGIGLAVSKALSTQGAHVWMLARDEDKLGKALEEVNLVRTNADQQCGFVIADVADYSQVHSALDQHIETAGLPDLVINSAGVAHPGYVEELDLDIFRWMMAVNFFGTVNVTKVVMSGMLERGSGHLVNISSLAGVLGVYGYTAYGASKFALRGFSDALRAEMKPKGVDVSIVYPPDVDTPQLEYENQHKPRETKALAGSGGLLSAEDCARAIIKGIKKNKYIILPGLESKLIFRLSGVLGGLVYPLMDMLIAQAQKKK